MFEGDWDELDAAATLDAAVEFDAAENHAALGKLRAAYETPTRIRERVKLMHPAERFPFGSSETTMRTDLDHVAAYNPTGPPGQASTANLSPLARPNHRLKTHSDWKVDPLDDTALRWVSPNGFKFRVDHTGTRRITDTKSEED